MLSVVASAVKSTLTVTVTYSPLNTDVTQVQTFVYGGRRMIYTCCNENRKAAVLGNPTLNGIDYLEVLDEADGCLSSTGASARCWSTASSRRPRR